MKIIRDIKPPLGVIPYKFYFKDVALGEIIPLELGYERVKHLQRAISECANNNREIPVEWVEELNTYIEYLEKNNVFVDVARSD